VELRRALLLFAIVLGVAAIASTVARQPDDDQRADQAPPTTSSASSPAAAPAGRSARPATIEFRAAARPQTRKLEVGQAATVLVDVETPGDVDIPSLGLTEPAEPLTPAMFELRVTSAGRHPIMVQPAASETLPSKAGTLVVVVPSSQTPSSRPASRATPKRSDRNRRKPAPGGR
jgi:hypothetical protein